MLNAGKQLIIGLFVVLISIGSTGLTITKHICGGKVVKSAVGLAVRDLDCGMKLKPRKCPFHSEVTKNCCSNIFEFIAGIEDVEKNHQSSIKPPIFIGVVVKFLAAPLAKKNVQIDEPLTYDPPPKEIPIYIKINSFLI